MQLALIPPLARLEDTLDQKMHLILPHLLRDFTYAQYVSEVAYSDDDYVILDNGLAEDLQVSDVAMLVLGVYYEVDELIVPDVLGDREATVARAKSFLNLMQEQQDEHLYTGSLALVAQGKTVEETVACAKDLVETLLIHSLAGTIMIPRRLVTAKEPHARLSVADALGHWWTSLGFGMDVHFLGGSKVWPSELRTVAESYPFVRSMDTSMPYVFARQGEKVDHLEARTTHRDADIGYWEWEPSEEEEELIKYNVSTMRKWLG